MTKPIPQLSVSEPSSTGIKGLDSSSLVVLRSIGMDQSLISRISSTPLPLPTNVPHAPKILKVNQPKEKISTKSDEKTSVTVKTNGQSEGSDHDHDKNPEDNDALASEDVSLEYVVEDEEEKARADFDDNNSEDMDVDIDHGQDSQSYRVDDLEDLYKDYDDDDDYDDAPDNGTTKSPPNMDNGPTDRLWRSGKSVSDGVNSHKSNLNDHTAVIDQDVSDKAFNSSTPLGTAWPRKTPITGINGSIIVVPNKIPAIHIGLDYQAEVVPYTTDSSGRQSLDTGLQSDEVLPF